MKLKTVLHLHYNSFFLNLIYSTDKYVYRLTPSVLLPVELSTYSYFNLGIHPAALFFSLRKPSGKQSHGGGILVFGQGIHRSETIIFSCQLQSE